MLGTAAIVSGRSAAERVHTLFTYLVPSQLLELRSVAVEVGRLPAGSAPSPLAVNVAVGTPGFDAYLRELAPGHPLASAARCGVHYGELIALDCERLRALGSRELLRVALHELAQLLRRRAAREAPGALGAAGMEPAWTPLFASRGWRSARLEREHDLLFHLLAYVLEREAEDSGFFSSDFEVRPSTFVPHAAP